MLNATEATQVRFLGEFVSRGRRWNAYSDGTALPVVGGGEGETPPPPAPTPPAAPPAPAPAPQLTPEQQAQLTRIAATEKAEGRNAALREVATALGIKPEDFDPAKVGEQYKQLQAAREAAMTEEQRRTAELERREADLATRETAAAASTRSATIRSALAGAGSLGDDQTDATVLLEREVAADANDEAITAAVGKLKDRRPELFRGQATPVPPTNSTPPTPPTTAPVTPGKWGEKGLEDARRFGLIPAS